MKNISHNNEWNSETIQVHVEPALIPLITSKNDEKSDKDFVKIRLRRDPTSEKLYLYQLKMALFDNGDPEEFLLFILNFNMTIEVQGTLKSGAKIQYILTMLHGEVLRQFYTLSAEVESATQ